MENIQGINTSYYCCPKRAKVKKPVLKRQETSQASDIKKFSRAKSSELRAKIIMDDRKFLDKITEYNSGLRQTKKIITLDRNPLFDCNIPYQPDNFYRMIGEGGYQDFLETGLIRPKQGTKQNYDEIYFEKGRANNIYARHNGAQYIVESSSKRIQEIEGHYPKTDKLDKDKDPFRIWHRLPSGGYEIVYDTMGDIISRNPEFRYDSKGNAA